MIDPALAFISLLHPSIETGTSRQTGAEPIAQEMHLWWKVYFSISSDITALQVPVIVNIPCFQFFVPLISLGEYQTLNLLSSIRECVHP